MTKRIPNPIDQHVGSRVRMRRMMLDMSQEKLGEAIDLTFQQIQKYEKGTNRIGASRLQQIATVLQVPVSFFFAGLPESGQPADDPATVAIREFVSSSDGLALARAFPRIESARLRSRIVALAEQLAA